jgi:EAL domain-containing protein (putative c-di-GMP-specific phosphodiesterase class I)/GGDEF domain-containing protein
VRLRGRDWLVRRLERASGGPRPFAVLALRVEGITEAAHLFGDDIADELALDVAARVSLVADDVAQLSEQELGGMVPAAGLRQAIDAARKLELMLEQPYFVQGQMLGVIAHIGVAAYPEHGQGASLLRRARLAMSASQRSGEGVRAFDSRSGMDRATALTTNAELRTAIERQELILHFQPEIELRTGEVRALEALVRWQHLRRGLLMPDAFIALAEQTSLIRRISQAVLNSALQANASLRKRGIPLVVAVNLSMRDLHDPQLPEQIEELLRNAGLPGAALRLEVTESGVMSNPAEAIRVLERLRDRGVSFSIDDFGTGYSSLSYLQRLPVSEIKIDKSFVASMATQPNDAVIVRSIVDLAHNLGFEVVAEGIETDETLHELVRMGCDTGQGFGLARPMPADAVAGWLAGWQPGAHAL